MQLMTSEIVDVYIAYTSIYSPRIVNW